MARLVRERDGEGYYGSVVEAITPQTGERELVSEPVIGKSLLVGTMTAGTYSKRDWWCTTPVTEIIKKTDKYIRFRTKNSIYKLYF